MKGGSLLIQLFHLPYLFIYLSINLFICLIIYQMLHLYGGQKTTRGESVLSFHHFGAYGSSQMVWLSGRHLYQLSHLTSRVYLLLIQFLVEMELGAAHTRQVLFL